MARGEHHERWPPAAGILYNMVWWSGFTLRLPGAWHCWPAVALMSKRGRRECHAFEAFSADSSTNNFPMKIIIYYISAIECFIILYYFFLSTCSDANWIYPMHVPTAHIRFSLQFAGISIIFHFSNNHTESRESAAAGKKLIDIFIQSNSKQQMQQKRSTLPNIAQWKNIIA